MTTIFIVKEAFLRESEKCFYIALKQEKVMEKSVFIRLLGKYRKTLPKQQLRILRGQALAGDVAGAKKGLEKVLKRRSA